MNKTFTRENGDVYATAEYNRKNNWIYANWIGYVSVEEIMEGGLYYIEMLKQTRCPKLLNDNRELVGPFQKANDWIAETWTPAIIANGTKYFAHIVSHGIYGQISAKDLHQRIAGKLEMRMFSDMEKAKDWLNSFPD